MTAIRLSRRKCLCILSFLVIATLPTAGQSAASGIISGTVTDSSGAAIPNAAVVITNTDTGAVHNLVTNEEGTFSVPFLQSGHYEVLAGAPSFTKADHKNLTLTVGETLTVNSTLAVSVNSDVQVTTEGSLIDTQCCAPHVCDVAPAHERIPAVHVQPVHIGLLRMDRREVSRHS
jgi:hypothetical protein